MDRNLVDGAAGLPDNTIIIRIPMILVGEASGDGRPGTRTRTNITIALYPSFHDCPSRVGLTLRSRNAPVSVDRGAENIGLRSRSRQPLQPIPRNFDVIVGRNDFLAAIDAPREPDFTYPPVIIQDRDPETPPPPTTPSVWQRGGVFWATLIAGIFLLMTTVRVIKPTDNDTNFWSSRVSNNNGSRQSVPNKSTDLSAALHDAFIDLASSFSSSVLDPSSILVDQCGIRNLGPSKAKQWGVCGHLWEHNEEDDADTDTPNEEESTWPCNQPRQTLGHAILQRVSAFCEGISRVRSSFDQESNLGGDAHHGIWLADIQNGSNACAEFRLSLKETGGLDFDDDDDDGDEDGNDDDDDGSNEGHGDNEESDSRPLGGPLWNYFRLGNFLACVDSNNPLTRQLDRELHDMQRDLMSVDDPRYQTDNEWRRAYQLSWHGPHTPAEAAALTNQLLWYFGPPNNDVDQQEQSEEEIQGEKENDVGWRAKRYAIFDIKRKPAGLGMLPWRVGNVRRLVEAVCTDFDDAVLSKLQDRFIPWGHGVVDTLHVVGYGGKEGDGPETMAWKGELVQQLGQHLEALAGLAGLPWREHCNQAVDGLMALEERLIGVGRTLQVAQQNGWVLVEDTTIRAGSSPSNDAQGLRVATWRVLIPPRRVIARDVQQARAELYKAVLVAWKTGLGSWQGATDAEVRVSPLHS